LALSRLAADICSRHRRFDRENASFVSFDMYNALEVVAFGMKEWSHIAASPTYHVPSEVSLRRQGLGGQVIDYAPRVFDAGSRRDLKRYQQEEQQSVDW
jgi:hypothetical protein